MVKKIWNNFEETILVASYLVTLVVLTVQVVLRYCFSYSFPWAEELARYVFVWQIWLASSSGIKDNRHIRIDIFTDKLKPTAYKIYEVFITLVSMTFCGFLAYKGMKVVSMIATRGQISGALHLPMQYVYLSVPFCCCLMIIR